MACLQGNGTPSNQVNNNINNNKVYYQIKTELNLIYNII